MGSSGDTIRLLRLLKDVCFISILSLTLGGCVVGPDFKAPESPKISSYTKTPVPQKTEEIPGQGEKTQHFSFTEQISQDWWTLFKCEALNKLIDRGLQNSPNLQAAEASIKQAMENLNVGMGGFYPSIDAQGTNTRQRESLEMFGFSQPSALGLSSPNITFTLYYISLNVSYNPDIFGALRRQVEGLGAQVDDQRYVFEATYLTLTSNIVTTAIREAFLRAQIQITKNIINCRERELQIIKREHSLGKASETDILAQETLVAQTKATLPPLESSLAQAHHALAVLVGELPSQANLPDFTLDDIHLPQELPLTLPSSLVQNRPDIKAAESLMHVANAQIGVATANMFPQLTLTGSIGDVSNQAEKLFAASSNIWSLSAQLLQPIFRGGAMIAKKRAAEAMYEQAFAQYRQTVLQAFQQVADVLRALVEDAKTHKAQVEAEAAAFKALEISRKEYHLGAINVLTLVAAERQYEQTRIARLQAEATRYADTAALFQALGGDCFALRNKKMQDESDNQQVECQS